MQNRDQASNIFLIHSKLSLTAIEEDPNFWITWLFVTKKFKNRYFFNRVNHFRITYP